MTGSRVSIFSLRFNSSDKSYIKFMLVDLILTADPSPYNFIKLLTRWIIIYG